VKGLIAIQPGVTAEAAIDSLTKPYGAKADKPEYWLVEIWIGTEHEIRLGWAKLEELRALLVTAAEEVRARSEGR